MAELSNERKDAFVAEVVDRVFARTRVEASTVDEELELLDRIIDQLKQRIGHR